MIGGKHCEGFERWGETKIDLAFDASALPEGTPDVGPFLAHVTAEELAAFEQAMMAMDNAPAEPAEQAPPFDMLSMQIDSPIEASEQSISIDAIDLQALQNL